MSNNGFRSALQPPLAPRRGSRLRVLGVARISKGTQRSLGDQEAFYREWLETSTDLPWELEMIATDGGGERLDRDELKKLRKLIKRETIDVVLTEDLGRIVRRVRTIDVCELCEDHAVRLIAINDHVDTYADNWRDQSFFAAYRHERHNVDLRNRIRRSLRNLFMNGRAVRPPIFGHGVRESPHIDPMGKKIVTDDLLYKYDWAVPVYEEWFRRLEDGASYCEIADWLNDTKMPVPKSALDKGTKKWTGRLVKFTTFNPLLKGVRVRNKKKSKRVNKTGRYKSIDAAPDELLQRPVPHLAFIEPGRWDALIKMLIKRNAKLGHPKDSDPRRGRPKKRSRWPGQHLTCGICGRAFVFGGHGQTHHLMCSGTRSYQCWLGTTVDGPLAARKMARAVFDEVTTLPDFDAELSGILQQQIVDSDERRLQCLQELKNDEERNARQRDHAVKAITDMGGNDSLYEELRRLEEERDQLADLRAELDADAGAPPIIPTTETVREMFRAAFGDLAVESYEFARIMRRLIPKIVVKPYRLCDGRRLVFRAFITLDLSKLHRSFRRADGVREHLCREIVVDLFDPPQRAAYRVEVIKLRKEGLPERKERLTEYEVARSLGLTVTAAQKAAALDRLMRSMGLTDPYLPVTEPPADISKLKRHLHPRYRFEPKATDKPG